MSPVNPAVLVVGSLHYDIVVEADHLPRRDETGVGHRWFPKFGGKGGNQAVAVRPAQLQDLPFAVAAKTEVDFVHLRRAPLLYGLGIARRPRRGERVFARKTKRR